MNNILPFIIIGLAAGSVYGLAGVGLVLSYRTSGIFNFAYGSLAAVSAFVYFALHSDHHMAWPLAALIALVVAGPVLGLLLERLGRVIANKTFTTQVAATVGILLIVQATAVLYYGEQDDLRVDQYLPTKVYEIFGTRVTAARLIVMFLGAALTLAVWLYLRYTRIGRATRAVVDNADLLDLSGTNPIRVRRSAWMIGTSLAALSGLLLAPLLPKLDGTTLTLLVVTAFGAAALGRFTSLPLTYAGGLTLGVAQSLATKYFTDPGWKSGISSSIPFIVLFAVLLISRPRRTVAAAAVSRPPSAAWRAPLGLHAGGAFVLVGFLLFVPSFAGAQIIGWTIFLANVVLFLSLGLLVRTSGQVSLCQVSFMAIGVAAFSHLSVGHGWPWLLALLAAGLIAMPVGAVLSIPAARHGALYLALATLGFGILLSQMGYSSTLMFDSKGLGLPVPRPSLSFLAINSDRGYFYFLLAVAILVSLLVVVIERSRLGRLLRALGDSTTGLSSCGTSVHTTRVVVFCLAAALAAIAGVLAGGATQVVSGAGYPPLVSVTLFVVVVITVGREPWYAVIAAAGNTLIPVIFQNSAVSNWLVVAFGVAAVLHAYRPTGASGLQRAIDKRFRRATVTAEAVPDNHIPGGARLTPSLSPARVPAPAGADGLSVDGLTVRFGGLLAVNGVSFQATMGRITGLIGPNGAGKTTTFNACTGLNRPEAGEITFAGRILKKRSASACARLGLGRTFQHMELFDSLSVRENVHLGREGGFAGPNPLLHIFSTPKEHREAASATDEALAVCQLNSIADMQVGALSTGQRRLVELARCLAGPFKLLLLDEPSSGLDRVETERFGQILREVVAQRGVGILIVEHDMSLVTSVCDYIYVLDFGQPIFSGTPDDVIASSVVQEAYLGFDFGAPEPAVTP